MSNRIHIDYLTLVSPEAPEFGTTEAQEVLRWAVALQGGENGWKCEEASILGYTGILAGKIFYGSRHDGNLLRVSGETADLVAREVASWGFYATRLDIALDVPVQTDDERSALVEKVTKRTYEFAREAKGRPWRVHPHGNGLRTTNVDVGVRTSPLYIRVYDKGEEQRDASIEVIRYEAEMKQERAQFAWQRIALDPDDRNVQFSLLYSALKERGIEVPITEATVEYRLDKKALPMPDAERSLEWLSKQVAPTVRRLTGIVERDRILLALGILMEDTSV